MGLLLSVVMARSHDIDLSSFGRQGKSFPWSCNIYRALDHLVQGKEEIEEALFARNRDLFSLAVDLVLFDTTLVHFEGQGPEGLATPARPGNYPECVKMLVGLVMTGDGFPVAHHVFPGNTADINAFRAALKELRRRFLLRRVVMVADRGVVSEGIMEEVEKEEVEYILGMRLRKSQEVGKEVLADLEQVRAVRFEARGKAWLWRKELPGMAYEAFRAAGLRPPPRVQPLA